MKRLATVAAFALVIAACGSDSGGDVATLEDTTNTTTEASAGADTDPEEALLEFAQCMRDSGVPDYPDPGVDENGNVQIFGGGGGSGIGELADRDTMEAAFEECGNLIEDVIQDTFRRIDDSEFQDDFLEFASCMREQGIDMPDPDFSGGFGPGGGGRQGLFGDIDPQDPVFQEAAEGCMDIFDGGFVLGGGRPGGDGG